MTDNDRNVDYPISLEPQDPFPFPDASYQECRRITQRVRHDDNAIHFYRNCVLVKTGNTSSSFPEEANSDEDSFKSDNSDESDSDSDDSNGSDDCQSSVEECAYLIIDPPIKEAIYGFVFQGRILTRNDPDDHWQLTNEKVAIKAMSLANIRQAQAVNSPEDPERECKAMQYLFHHHGIQLGSDCKSQVMYQTNTIMQLDALYDDECFYSVLPFIEGHELFRIHELVCGSRNSFTEEESRFIIKKILHAIQWNKRAGVYHKDICLENVMMSRDGRVVLIDFGMCLKIPQDQNGERTLITRQIQPNRPYLMAPEVFGDNSPSFDGCTVDLWAVSIILFILLIGFQPWETPNNTDERFRQMTGSRDRFMDILQSWGVQISDAAVDLLQKMLVLNPRDRLTLDEVLEHSWMEGTEVSPYG